MFAHIFHKRVVISEGFRDGTQNINPGSAQKMISAQFDQKRQKCVHQNALPINMLEAKRLVLQQRKEAASDYWQGLLQSFGPMAPQRIKPLIALITVYFGAVGEAGFLAPVMDGLGIADQTLQLILAAVLVLVSSGLCHFLIHHYHTQSESRVSSNTSSERTPQPRYFQLLTTFLVLLFAAFVFTLLSLLGWWRAGELIFAASLENGELSNFLNRHSALTHSFITLLTIALPIYVAVAFEWSFDRLHRAREWRRGRRDYHKYSRRFETVDKKLTAVVLRGDCAVKALDAQEVEFLQAYLQHYDLGKQIGAHKQPTWHLVVKIIAVIPLILVGCMSLEPLFSLYLTAGVFRGLFYAFATMGVGGLHAYRAIKAWERPNALQMYSQMAIRWRGETRGYALPAESEDIRGFAPKCAGTSRSN
jgi:hypothetical protein